MALLLDRVGAEDWKSRLVAENQILQNALAEAVNYRARKRRLVAAVLVRHDR